MPCVHLTRPVLRSHVNAQAPQHPSQPQDIQPAQKPQQPQQSQGPQESQAAQSPALAAPVIATAKPTRADLINAESRLGSRIFGPVPEGHNREFFHDRQNIWIWHEDWSDQAGHPRQLTVRYEVRPSGVFKKIAAGKYLKLEGDELENFRKATRAYLRVIKQHLYHQA